MHVPSLIEHKRNGETHQAGEISKLIAGFTAGEIHDYQLSAWAMAVYFRGLTDAETGELTRAMRESGRQFSWPKDLARPLVDKHSSGGIGDKVSLVLAPLLAATGHRVPMVSGRGLGITGGTLDKLESMPGMRTDLSFDHASQLLEEFGFFMMGQTADFCPADRKLYALRDVSGTVPSIPLITASIMSKKLAEGLDKLVLDVKFGSGAFMKSLEDAHVLAEKMQAAGQANGVETHFLLTPMDQPLGRAVGNFTEVRESIQCLSGQGPADLEKLVLDLCEPIAKCSREELKAALYDGRARQGFFDLAAAQGTQLTILFEWLELNSFPDTFTADIESPKAGKIRHVHAGKIGQLLLELGAGRASSNDSIHPFVGLERLVQSGDTLGRGDRIATLYLRSKDALPEAKHRLLEAIKWED